ncbi:hypothetical protein B0H11DRAFT_2275215 [Mycena galericulata]|nr:hypothetical protein B0H11DRAFT_2275215 [Mycena galericulata]
MPAIRFPSSVSLDESQCALRYSAHVRCLPPTTTKTTTTIFNGDPWREQLVSPGFTGYLSNASSLQIVTLYSELHAEDINELASLSALTTLTIKIKGSGSPFVLHSRSPRFPSLQTLDVKTDDKTLLPQFLEQIDTSSLTRLAVSSEEHRWTPHIIGPICRLVARKWPGTLRSLFLDIVDRPLFLASFSSLGNLTVLEHLRVHPAAYAQFTDAEFLATIQPLPHLVSLSAFGWRGLSVAALRHLSVCCPALRSLDLTFDPPALPPAPGTPCTFTGAIPHAHALDTLIVNVSYDGPHLTNAEAMAGHLHRIFPALRTIAMPKTATRTPRGITQRVWERVEELLYEGCPACS